MEHSEERQQANPQSFKVHEYSSRKLWEMVSAETKDPSTTQDQLIAAVRELEQRQHYLAELERIGKLSNC